MSQKAGAEQSTIAMAREIADEASRMIRADIELARKDLLSMLRRAIVAIVLLTMAAVLLLIAVIEALDSVPVTFGPRLFGDNPWLPWLALGGVFLVLSLLFALAGYRLGIRGAVRSGRRVVDAVKEDVEWARRLARRRGKSTS